MIFKKYDLFIDELLLESLDPNNIDKFKRPKPKVYHRTKDEKVDVIGRDGYRAGPGAAWGPGIYTVYDLTSTTKENTYNRGDSTAGTYGPIIIENEVQSLRSFLIFNVDIAKRVYKDKYTVEDQLRNILPEKAFKRNEEVIKQASEKCLELVKANPKNKYTARVFDNILPIKEIMHHLRGVIFTGENDGNVLLSYDRENLVPVRYSKDNGKNWTKITKQGAYLKARRNLKALMTKGDTKSLAALIEDHITNELSNRYGVTDVEQYITSKKISELDLESIMPFTYIFNLDESDYTSIATVKNKIKIIYKPVIESILEKMRSIDDFESVYKIIDSTQINSIMNILEKVYPEKNSEFSPIMINFLKEIKEYLSVIDEVNLNKVFRLKERLDNIVNLIKLDKESKDIMSDINDEIIPNVIKARNVTLKLVTNLAISVENFNNTFKQFFYNYLDNRTALTGADVTKLVEISKDIESKLDSVIEKNQKFTYTGNRMELTKYNFDKDGVFTPIGFTEDVYVDSSILFLSNKVISNFIKVGLKIDNTYSGQLNDFFKNFEPVYKIADQIAKKYLDVKFEENIEILVKSDFKDGIDRYFGYESIPYNTRIKILLSDNIKSTLKEDEWEKLVIDYTLALIDRDGNDSNLLKKTIELVKNSGIRVSVEEMSNYYLKLSPSLRILYNEGIIDKDILFMFGLLDLYSKEPEGFLSDEEKKVAEERLQDDTFIKQFLKFVESSTQSSYSENKLENILLRSPIKLSKIIDENLLSELYLRNIIEVRIKDMIKNKKFEKLGAFIDFFIEKKVAEKLKYKLSIFSGYDNDMDDVKVQDIPIEILTKIIENRIFNMPDSYKNDDLAIAMAKKGIIDDRLAESDSTKEILALAILKKENISYDEFKDIRFERLDVKQNIADIVRLFSSMKEDPDNAFLGAYIFISTIISNPKMFDDKISKENMSKMMASLDKHFSEMESVEDLDMFREKEMIVYQKKNPGFNKKNILSFLQRIKTYFKSEKSIDVIDKYLAQESPQIPVTEKIIFKFDRFIKSRYV